MAWDPGNGMILQLHLTQFERPKDVNLDPIPVAKRSQDFPKRTPHQKLMICTFLLWFHHLQLIPGGR